MERLFLFSLAQRFLLISLIFDLENIFLDSLNFFLIFSILILGSGSLTNFINSSLDLYLKSLTFLSFAITFNFSRERFMIYIVDSNNFFYNIFERLFC